MRRLIRTELSSLSSSLAFVGPVLLGTLHDHEVGREFETQTRIGVCLAFPRVLPRRGLLRLFRRRGDRGVGSHAWLRCLSGCARYRKRRGDGDECYGEGVRVHQRVPSLVRRAIMKIPLRAWRRAELTSLTEIVVVRA